MILATNQDKLFFMIIIFYTCLPLIVTRTTPLLQKQQPPHIFQLDHYVDMAGKITSLLQGFILQYYCCKKVKGSDPREPPTVIHIIIDAYNSGCNKVLK